MGKIIFLVGARGSGKSTVGRKVAEYLTWSFSDTDDVLQARMGCSIAHMVEHFGWEAFRKAESEALQACVHEAQDFPLVLATGGGMVLAEENRLLMREQGLVFFLDVSVSSLVQRLTLSPNAAQRPSLTGQDITTELQSVLEQRFPLYKDVAHHTVNGSLPIAHVTEKIYTATLKHFSV